MSRGISDSGGTLATALARVTEDLGHAPPAIAEADLDALGAGAAGDVGRLKRWIKRRLAGEPLAYILGEITFRGRHYRIDARTYITDPEASFVVDAAIAAADAIRSRDRRAAIMAEIGAGCGSLAISLKLERPDLTTVGLEIDPAALSLAKENGARHHADIEWVESDLFDSWPLVAAPDVIFGDPPWGSEHTLYTPERDASHYRAMPATSAFPLGGRTGLHRQILRAVTRRGWRSHVILNGGVLPPAELSAVARDALWHEITSPAPGLSLLHCRMS